MSIDGVPAACFAVKEGMQQKVIVAERDGPGDRDREVRLGPST